MTERQPGPVWGGWWLWEPPAGRSKEQPDYMAVHEDIVRRYPKTLAYLARGIDGEQGKDNG